MSSKSMAFNFYFFIVLFTTSSCVTYNPRNPYPGMEIVRYGNSHAYVFQNKSSDKLVIHIDGSGWDSVLETKNDKEKWISTHNGAQLLQVLRDKYTFFIPEKLNRQPGMTYRNDMEDRAQYTAHNLLDCYIRSINGYLSENSFSSIILVGTSEGAILLPLVYERMEAKDKVKALVSIGFGGLSFYESYDLLAHRYEFPQGQAWDNWKKMYDEVLEQFKPGKEEYPDSFEEDYYDLTCRWFASFVNIRPVDYYQDINIPVLFIHGKNDYSIPVLSTSYIQHNLPEKSFEYRYYNWGHQAVKYSDLLKVRKDTAKWIDSIFAGVP